MDRGRYCCVGLFHRTFGCGDSTQVQAVSGSIVRGNNLRQWFLFADREKRDCIRAWVETGKLLLIYIWNFNVLSHLLLIYICKFHWNLNTMLVIWSAHIRSMWTHEEKTDEDLLCIVRWISQQDPPEGKEGWRDDWPAMQRRQFWSCDCLYRPLLGGVLSGDCTSIEGSLPPRSWYPLPLTQVTDLLTWWNAFISSPGTFFWFDVMSINQHSSRNEVNQDWFEKTFKNAIEEIGHTVLLFSPWQDKLFRIKYKDSSQKRVCKRTSHLQANYFLSNTKKIIIFKKYKPNEGNCFIFLFVFLGRGPNRYNQSCHELHIKKSRRIGHGLSCIRCKLTEVHNLR